MKDKLISAEDLFCVLRDDININGSNLAKVKRHIEAAPAVDAVEVVHGRCDWCNGEYHTKIMATAIRYHSNGNMDGYEMKVNYCPNCGAKMRGNEE